MIVCVLEKLPAKVELLKSLPKEIFGRTVGSLEFPDLKKNLLKEEDTLFELV